MKYVVFDASAKYHTACLNDHYLRGPDLLNNLISIFVNFFLGEIVVLGGIEQAFNQVKAKDTDRDALHFLRREPPGKTIGDYQMTTHLFGKIDFPCCSNFANKRSVLDKTDVSVPSVVKIDRQRFL